MNKFFNINTKIFFEKNTRNGLNISIEFKLIFRNGSYILENLNMEYLVSNFL